MARWLLLLLLLLLLSLLKLPADCWRVVEPIATNMISSHRKTAENEHLEDKKGEGGGKALGISICWLVFESDRI
jgi:hypothetical protein